MARAKQVHVVWNKKHQTWRIKRDGKYLPRRAPSNHKNMAVKTEVIKDAKWYAKESKCELVIHRKDGVIQRKHSYGNDPRSSKG